MMWSLSRKFRITEATNKQLFRLVSSTSQVADTQLDNAKAIKLIDYLYVNNRKKSKDKYKAISEAFEIYAKIIEPPNYGTIDTLLKLFFYFGLPHQYVSIWKDIERLSSETNNNHNNEGVVCYAMLLKCCIETNRIKSDDCMQVLSWIKSLNYELKIKEKYIGKLIIHCAKEQNLPALDFMYTLFTDQLFDCNPIFIKTTFINAYSISNTLSKSVDIFNAIPASELNMICVGSMMKRYIYHHCYIDALSLYDTIDAIDNQDIHQNDYCDSMALQACIHSNNLEKGKTIHDNINHKLHSKGKSELEMNDYVRHSLISFHGTFGNVTESERLFGTMRNNHANMIALNSMMNVYIKNGDNESALNLYKHALEMNELSNVLAISACMNTNNYILGKRIYGDMKINNYDMKLKRILIEFFGKCSDVQHAKQMFETINPRRMTIEIVIEMLRVYANNECYEDVLQLYDNVMNNTEGRYIGCVLNNLCHSLAIKSAMKIGNRDKCEEIIRVNQIEDKNDDIELKQTLVEYYEEYDDLENSLKKMLLK